MRKTQDAGRHVATTREALGFPPARHAHTMRRYAVSTSLAVMALLIPRGHIDAPKASSRLATVPVVVAAKDMPEGVTIDRVGLVVAQWPAGTQPMGAYSSVDSVAGRVTQVPVYKGEAIVPGRLALARLGAGLEVKITPGKRAYDIRINDVANLAGMLQPNSRVDIMVVVHNRDARPPVARLLMSNMRVLDIGLSRERQRDGQPASAVASIEVTPAQAKALGVAARQGSLQLLLRGDDRPTP